MWVSRSFFGSRGDGSRIRRWDQGDRGRFVGARGKGLPGPARVGRPWDIASSSPPSAWLVPGFCFGQFSRFGSQQRTESSSDGNGIATMLSLVMNEGRSASCWWRRAMFGLLGSGVIGANGGHRHLSVPEDCDGVMEISRGVGVRSAG